MKPIFELRFPDKMSDWHALSGNVNAISLIENHTDKIWWSILSKNPNAIHLLDKKLSTFPSRINSFLLSSNPNALHLLEKYPEKRNMYGLSANPNAIPWIEQHLDRLEHWELLILSI